MNNFLRKYSSIKYKFLFGILSITFFITFVSFFIIISRQQSDLRKDLISNTTLNAKLISNIAVSSLAYNDDEGIVGTLSKIQFVPYLKAAFVYDTAGNIIAKYISDSSFTFYEKFEKNRADLAIQSQNDMITVIEVIQNGEYRYGYLKISASEEQNRKRITSYIIFMLILLVAEFIFAIFVADFIRKRLTSPIVVLAEEIHNFSENDNYKPILPEVSPDEIGSLYESFIKMVDIIQYRRKLQLEAEQKLSKLNEELEDTITRRTILLEAAVEQLKYEVAEREKAASGLLQAREELSEALKIEKELNELKSRFIAMVSHEYRTPLTVILSSASLMVRYSEPKSKEDFEKHYRRIQNSIDKMLNLLNDVLTLGKLDSDKYKVNKIKLDLVDHFNMIIEEKKNEFPKRKILFNTTENEINIYSDKMAFNHIFENLLGNALKYSATDTPAFVTLNRTSQGVYFEVTDQGIGLSDEIMQNPFEPFQRGNNAMDISGTGLGLSIVKKIIDQLGGSITFKSETGKGTVFQVYIPVEFAEIDDFKENDDDLAYN